MKTEVHLFTYSKAITIIKCCVAALIIASFISFSDKINIREFINNILEWESI